MREDGGKKKERKKRSERKTLLQERDIEALRYLGEMGFGNVDLLWRFAWGSVGKVVAYDRIEALLRAAFIEQVKDYLPRPKVFILTDIGRETLQPLCNFVVPSHPPKTNMIPHQLELGELRLFLEKKGITNWRSAEVLQVSPDFTRIGGKLIPDVIYKRRNGEFAAIELDRARRSRRRLKERLEAYGNEFFKSRPMFSRLFYIVSPALVPLYSKIFKHDLIKVLDFPDLKRRLEENE